jgi:hypothetical protein
MAYELRDNLGDVNRLVMAFSTKKSFSTEAQGPLQNALIG